MALQEQQLKNKINYQKKASPPVFTQFRNKELDEEQDHYSITIGKSPQEIFSFWRNFSNLKLFMKDISNIQVSSPNESRWTVQLKSGEAIQWDVEITEAIEGKMIGWKSVGSSQVQTMGCVYFTPAPENQGTTVRLSMIYNKPKRMQTEFIEKFSGEDPENLILMNLRRLKAVMETGEVPAIRSRGQCNDRAIIM
jgi:uncharacterized membrane protein